MDRLKYFKLFEDKVENEKDDKDLLQKQNDIPGTNYDSPLAIFTADMEMSPIVIDSIPGYNFIMASEKRELWILEGRECHLIGLGSPFGREDYVAYLNTLPKYGVSMLAERMEHYGFKDTPNSLMFGINGTVRVLDAHQVGMRCIAYPGENVDYEVVTDINDKSLTDKFKNMVEKVVGSKMMPWLRKKFEQQQK